ncbi:MlaD family protein [Polaribacter porphyrae]|uniref:ABC transporter substrate-binding protein n=1 Tax=Polaribacter porphyrae TaxID=1137780 RepID=A0A2S7WLK5_9FLAO|nr:MlaD family protein [Polaribacter porphyrae]PQJ78479.1 ABC transporter substrate-binding protein [Polaribacter porphyrae]
MSKELKTGIIVILIITAFIWGFNFLKGHDLLDGKAREFKVEYKKIGGLNRASTVTLNGLKVGQVKEIVFDEREETRGHLIVTFAVENDFQFSKNSIVRIYSPNPLAGSNLAIIPDYEGDLAVSGDMLKGEMEESLFTSIGERLDPLQTKIEQVIVKADTLFSGINKILNNETVNNINSSVSNIGEIIRDLKQTVKLTNNIIDQNQENLKTTLLNTKNISENLSKISDSLTMVNVNSIVKKAENAVDNFNELSKKLNSNDGSIGKLLNDDKLYNNIEAATKELEQLMRDLKLNPKRYVHFSLFGKKPKPYKPSLPDSLAIIKD